MITHNQVPKSQSAALIFHYLYRDAGNYKQWGLVVLACAEEMTAEAATVAIEKLLIDGQYFVAEKVGVPVLRTGNDADLDHGWHEFSNFGVGSLDDLAEMDFNEFLERFAISKIH